MKKDGDWIAVLGAELEVSRVDVSASPALDLIEVRTTPRGVDRPGRVDFYDRHEASRLVTALAASVAELVRENEQNCREA